MTLPPYPQYGPPQQRRQRPWLWALVGALVGSVLTAAAGVAIVIGIGIWILRGSYIVGDPEVIEATAEPCAEVADAAQDLSRFSGASEGARALGQLAEALDGVVGAIDETGASDEGAVAWRRDLSDLAQRVDDYATAVSEGDLSAPDLGAGSGLIERLDVGAPAGCEIPAALSSLDPDDQGSRGGWG